MAGSAARVGAQSVVAPVDLTAATKAASADPELAAMEAELQREVQLLVLPGLERPFFVEYRLDDFSSWQAVANYGAVARSERGHQRVVRATVRVGDYKSDSSSGQGDGVVELAPEDNDPVALKYALWTATDDAYKAALRAFAAKQAALKRFEKAPGADDFAREKPVVDLEPVLKLEIDEAGWQSRIADASGLFLTEPKLKPAAAHVEYSSADVRGLVVNRYLVNSEGTVVRHGYSGYAASYSVGGQAEDGERLERDNGTTAAVAGELEDDVAFRRRIEEDVLSYEALREAPVADAEDFHGPVLFSGDAAASVLDRLFVADVEARRPEMGTAARTTGAYRSSLRAPVLGAGLSVTDDPLRARFNGIALVGAYKVDDQGVPAQLVKIVEDGKLESYLTDRTPIRDFPASNGHGRAAPAQAAQAAAGVVVFSSANALPVEQLRAKLLALATEQQRDVYEVETMGGDLSPRLLYRVHPDGSRELVRGAVFDELDTRSLRSDIVGVGNDVYVDQELGAVPETILAPSLLFGDIGVKRANEEQQKLPYYAPPQ